MKLFLRMICAAMLLGLCVVPATAQRADVYVWVSTVGDNMADGTETAPLASVQQALAKVRALRETADPETLGDVHIVLRSGTYRLTETLRLTAEDSGTPASATIIEAEAGGTVVLSGGAEITGWQAQGDVEGLPSVAQGQVWVAEVPCVGSTAVPFRQMWIGNNKMRRAGTFDGKTLPRIISVNKERGELIVPRPAQTFARPDRVEMTIIQDWVTNVMRVERISTVADRSVFTFKQPESGIEFKRPWPILRADASSSTNHMFYLSNAIELLNHPQEWFCDTDQGLVYYWPRSGETPATTVAVVPLLETLVSVAGDGSDKVEHVAFKGLTFAHSAWHRPSLQGHVPLQAGQWLYDAYTDKDSRAGNVAWVGRPAAAVSVSDAGNVSFEGCNFRQTASTAIDFVRGTRQTVVRGCTFSDVGGSAVLAGYFGDETFEAHEPYNPENTDEVCDGITIDNNYIAHPATEDWGTLGICIGYASNVNITHNEIYDTPYTGISMGWGWTKEQNCMHDNHIQANYIHSFCNQMRDGGAIYTLSSQPNSSIENNRIEDVGHPQFNPIMWEGMAHAQFDLYTDEGSDYFTVKNNWCERGEISKNQNGGHNVWGTNNNTVAEAIKQAAGLEAEYEHIKQFVVEQNLAPLDSVIDESETAQTLAYPTPKSAGTPVSQLIDGEEYVIQNSNTTLERRNLYWEWGLYLRTRSDGCLDDVTFVAHKHEAEGQTWWSFEITSATGRGKFMGRSNGSNVQFFDQETLWTATYEDTDYSGFVLLMQGDTPGEGHELTMNGSGDWVCNYTDGATTDKTANTTHWSFVRTADLSSDAVDAYNAAKLCLYQYLVETAQMCERGIPEAAETYDTVIGVYNNEGATTGELQAAANTIKSVIAGSVVNYKQDIPATFGIVNPSFENNSAQHGTDSSVPFGWTMTRDGSVVTSPSDWAWCGVNGDVDNGDGALIWGVWHWGAYGNMELSQTVAGLPNGRYRLTARLMNNHTENGNLARIFAATGSMLAGTEGDYTTLPEGETCSFEGGWASGDRDLSHVFAVEADVTDGTLTIGARSNGFFKIDDFRLTFLGNKATSVADVPAIRHRTSSVYDLTGRKVNVMKRGIYIIDGRKVLR